MNLSDHVWKACFVLIVDTAFERSLAAARGPRLASASALGLSAAGDECTERGEGEGAAVLGAGVDAGEGDGANGCVSPKEDLKMRRVRRGQLR